MSIGYYVYENQLTEPLSYKCVPVSARVMQIEDIAGVISLKNPTLTTDIVKATLSLLATVVSQELKKGNSVNLQNFMSFVITIPSRAETIDSIDTSRMNVIGKPSSTLASELNSIATTTRLGVNIKYPSIISASDTNTGLQNWLRQGYGLDIQGDNLDFNLDDQSQGIFLTSPAGNTYRIDNVSYITKKRVLLIPELDTNEGPAGKGSVEYGLQIKARYTLTGALKTGWFNMLRKTNVIDADNTNLFVKGNADTGPVVISGYYGDPIITRIIAQIRTDNTLTISAGALMGNLGQPVVITDNGAYTIIGNVSIEIQVVDYNTLYSNVIQNQRYLQEIVYMNPTTPVISIVDIVAEEFNSISIMSDGSLYICGSNQFGQIGDNTTINNSNPVLVSGTFAKVVFSTYSTYAIKEDGTLWSWGYNAYGQLGHGDAVNRHVPTQVGSDADWENIFTGVDAQCAFAIKNDGTLWGCGYNAAGQLGLGNTTNKNVFTKIGTDTDWNKVRCSFRNAFAFKNDGSLYVSGNNTCGQLGLGDTVNKTTFTLMPSGDIYSDAIPADFHTVLLKKDGTIWGCGDSQYGVLGDVTSNYINTSPLQIGTESNWTAIEASVSTTCATNSNNELFATGENKYGQFGLGNNTNYFYAMTKVGFTGQCVKFGVGKRHIVLLDSTGVSYSSGAGNYGQLGNGLFNSTNVFVENNFNLG